MSKAVSFKAKDAGGPPEHSAWVWHTSELLRSPAWHGASLNLRRLLDYLEVEHLRHERIENGALMALYDDLEKIAGIGRRLILPSIIEGERRGLVEVVHGLCLAGGKRQPSRFRLTYLPTCSVASKVTTWHAPTNEWRRYVEPQRRNRNFSAMSKGEPVPVHEGEPVEKATPAFPPKTKFTKVNRSPVHEGELPLSSYLQPTPPAKARGGVTAPESDPAARAKRPDIDDYEDLSSDSEVGTQG